MTLDERGGLIQRVLLLSSATDRLRARLERHLEQGREGTRAERLLASGWQALAAPRLARPLALPSGRRVIGVGSAVLGGAGKTPVAIALTRALARHAHEVALVSHAYRARPIEARRVGADDPVDEVGDDALHAARELDATWQTARGVAPPCVNVVVGPSRQAALDYAAALGARTLIVDGLLQAAPHRLTASILVVDEHAPWGSGACPPLGDLRASPRALLRMADLVVVVGERIPSGVPAGAILVPSRLGVATDAAGLSHDLDALRRASLGLLLGVARPERVTRALRARGVEPAVVLRFCDHARFAVESLGDARRPRVDAWLTTGRCATKLPARWGDAPVLRLRHEVDVAGLVQALEGSPSTSPMP